MRELELVKSSKPEIIIAQALGAFLFELNHSLKGSVKREKMMMKKENVDD